jgi:hypothetical protein
MKQTTKTYLTDKSKLRTEVQLRAEGYTPVDECGDGFWQRESDKAYAELIADVRVLWLACDSYGKYSHKKFDSIDDARTFIAEEWPEDGRVSTDGISRFCGIEVKVVNSKIWQEIAHQSE